VIDDSSSKPPGYYVQRSSGLFPAALIQDSVSCEKACRLFKFLGVFIAKVLQDGRLVDLPLSRPFFKLLCSGEFGSEVRERYECLNRNVLFSFRFFLAHLICFP
jgi:E3 ubiquitin-protein ligase HECTD1